MTTTEEFLEHHGVKGMKWGIRKERIKKSTKRRAKQFQANRKAKAKRQIIATRRRQLSEGDLRKFVDRLQTEKKLKDLIEADIKPGRSVSKRILSDSGQKVARTVIAGGGLILVKAAVDKKMGKSGTGNENMNLLNQHIKAVLTKKK